MKKSKQREDEKAEYGRKRERGGQILQIRSKKRKLKGMVRV